MRTMAVIMLSILPALPASGQGDNPVYTDDSPAARDTLDRLTELVESGNLSQGVRSIQKLLDEESDRTLMVLSDQALYRSVRDAVHERLLAEPSVLERYRQMQESLAQRLLEIAGPEVVETSYLLTSAGYEAALRVAQTHLEHARFEAARLTLEQLERHPDRGAAAAELMTSVAMYLDRDDVWDRAIRWSEEAELPAPEVADAARPDAADAMWRWAFDPIDEAALPAAPRRPLWSSPLVPDRVALEASANRAMHMTSAPNEVLWVLPSASEDAIFTNDGVWISSWDRYTLERRWRVRPPTASDPMLNDDITDQRMDPRSFGSRIEDPSSVTVVGPVVVATTGFATSGMREGDPRVHVLDAETGEVIWSKLLQRLDSRLEQSVPLGAALVDADTLVIAARKSVPGRRIISLSLVGLDLHTGDLRWIRPIASAGALPYVGRNDGNCDGAVLHEGVFIRTDKLGVISAVDAVSGRPRWIRTMSPAGFTTSRRGEVFECNVPVVHDGLVYVRSADRRSILALDVDTGRLVHARSAGQFGSPRYLLAIGDHLAAVGPKRVGFVAFETFADEAPRFAPEFDGQGIQGRALAMGGMLVAPTDRGLVVVDPVAPSDPPTLAALDKPGNPLPMGSALIVVDDMEVHSYLDWTVAERLLRQRMDDEPDDPAPAITYAELAFRAGRAGLVPDAAGRALDAIRRRPTEPDAKDAQRRLFEALQAMVEDSQEGWEKPANDDLIIRDLDVMEQIVARLSQAADSASQRATALLVEGRLRTSMLEPERAIEAYQTVLADPILAGQDWGDDDVPTSAGQEAAARVRALVLEFGQPAYAAFEAEAERRLATLPANASAETLEAMANRYPAASQTSTLWRRAAESHAEAGQESDELRCLHNALLTARLVYEAGIDPNPAPLVRAAVAQVDALSARGRYAGAAHALQRFEQMNPELDLSSVDRSMVELRSELRDQLRTSTQPARIGLTLGPVVQSLVGWELMSPMLSGDRPAPGTDHVMLMSADRVALFGDIGPGEDGSIGTLAELWHRPFDRTAPDLVRTDPDAVYLAWNHRRGIRLERIDAITGETTWLSEPFQDLFQENAQVEQLLGSPNSRFRTPRRRDVHVTDTLLAADDGAFLIVERSGRVGAIDEQTGEVLWSLRSPITQVFEADAAQGVLLIGGDITSGNGRGGESRDHGIHAIDTRSGRDVARDDTLGGQAEWVRVADPTTAIIKTGRGVHAYDMSAGRLFWTIDADPGLAALAGWVFDDDLYIVDSSRALWHASISSARLSSVAPSNHLAGSRQIDLLRLDDGRIGVLSSGGVLLIEGDELIAADGLSPLGGLIQPVPTQGRIVALEMSRRQDEELRPMHLLHVLDTETARLQRTNVLTSFWDNPRMMTAINSHLVVSSGPMTFVFDTPPGNEQARE